MFSVVEGWLTILTKQKFLQVPIQSELVMSAVFKYFKFHTNFGVHADWHGPPGPVLYDVFLAAACLFALRRSLTHSSTILAHVAIMMFYPPTVAVTQCTVPYGN